GYLSAYFFQENLPMIMATSIPNTNCAQSLGKATLNILRNAFYLAKQKLELSRKAYKQLIFDWGWEKEDKKYLKVAQTFEKFAPLSLAQIEPATIFLLANQNQKYAPVIEQLLDISYITQEKVRELIKQQRKPKPFQSEKPSIWRRTRDGRRYCQVPPIHDQATGVALQRMMDSEGKSAQQIIAESLALRQAMKEGRLVEVSQTQEIENIKVETQEPTESDESLNNETYVNNSSGKSIIETDSSETEVDESVFSSDIILNPKTTQETVEFLSHELFAVVENIKYFGRKKNKEAERLIAQIIDYFSPNYP
ncbi:MAG: hypothetical protein AAFW70_12405, partial [Cyanobacteria bacterium J06635_10]